MLRHAFPFLLAAALAAGTTPVRAGARPERGTAGAGSTQFLIFDATPAGSYDVRKNGVATGSSVAGPGGVLVHEADAAPGDRFDFLLTGVEPVDPSRPAGFAAAGNTQGCAVLSWNAPASGEYVTDYEVLWGRTQDTYTDSVTIDMLDIAKSGPQWFSTRCGFANGTYYFALRAHNSFDRWSALSDPAAATISNQDTQGPVPPTGVKVAEPSFGCATVTWTRSGDPAVTGYRVYFGTKPRTQAAYTDSVEAGNTASASRCALAQGTYYFAVRAYTGVGVFSGYSKEVSLTAQGADVSAPSVSQRSPAAGATNVPLNAGIYFVVSDDKAGVDAASIAVRVDGQAVSHATSTSPSGVAVQCDPPGDFAADADVIVEVVVQDRATPPNPANRTWSFHTGTTALTDTEAPLLAATAPGVDASDVDPRPTIAIQITDAGLGVDLSSIVLEVDGGAVAYAVDGTPASARVTYRPPSDFAPGSDVHVHVEACDRAPGPNCAAPLDYRFTVRSVLAQGQGAIVPDGFWANQPDRPLEIRNLPRDWSVRIFDASGLSVRHHQNRVDGATWLWDFTNDNGRRVAPALYLVRVTDGGGTVHASGRFLVQSPQ